MSACTLFIGYIGPKGYGRTSYKGKSWQAHRLAWALQNGTIPPGLCVLHKCDTRACINVEHLFLGTNADNVKDKMSKGRHKSLAGEAHPKTSITKDQVLELRALRKQGVRVYDLSLKFNVSESTVYHICSKYTWKT